MRIAFLRCERICQWHFERFITTANSITSTCSGNCCRRRKPNKWQDVGVFSTLMTIISVWWKIAVGYAAVTQDRSRINLTFAWASRNNSALYIYNFMGLFTFILTEMQCRNQFIYDRNFVISVTVMRDWVAAQSMTVFNNQNCHKCCLTCISGLKV